MYGAGGYTAPSRVVLKKSWLKRQGNSTYAFMPYKITGPINSPGD